jgi:hypothetical protein
MDINESQESEGEVTFWEPGVDEDIESEFLLKEVPSYLEEAQIKLLWDIVSIKPCNEYGEQIYNNKKDRKRKFCKIQGGLHTLSVLNETSRNERTYESIEVIWKSRVPMGWT